MKSLMIDEILRKAIDLEQTGIEFYASSARNWDVESPMHDYLELFREDELHARTRLSGLRDFYSAGKKIAMSETLYERWVRPVPAELMGIRTGHGANRAEVIHLSEAFEQETIDRCEVLQEMLGTDLSDLVLLKQTHFDKMKAMETMV
ncbi:MAG: hypothetical protein RRB13_08775 [bacterium]|nr:hypothetical protein [bacterium]